jgi:hypothetical protein
MKSGILAELHATGLLEFLATKSVILITSKIRQKQSIPMRKTAELVCLNLNTIWCHTDSSASEGHKINAHTQTHYILITNFDALIIIYS